MVEVFAAVRRVLRDDGVLWLNLGDTYATGGGKVGECPGGGQQGERWKGNGRGVHTPEHSGKHGPVCEAMGPLTQPNRMPIAGLKPKDLCMIPARVALALQADGWWLRSDVIWAKPNPMPESVTDRPTRSHEYLFLLTKSERYYYDAQAIAETAETAGQPIKMADGWDTGEGGHGSFHRNGREKGKTNGVVQATTRNARSVWTIATQPYPQAHFATFPVELARRCILAGSKPGDTVLDPFGGSGTVAQVATGNGRNSIYIDLNPKYLELARQRIGPMLVDEVSA